MACQGVCKQGRDDIIVKVNLQSLIPASFLASYPGGAWVRGYIIFTLVCNFNVKRCRDRACTPHIWEVQGRNNSSPNERTQEVSGMP